MAVVPPALDRRYLSAGQQEHFATFGYLHMPQLFSPEESARISLEFDATIDSFIAPPVALETPEAYEQRVSQHSGAGAIHDGTERTMIGGPIEHRMSWILDVSTPAIPA